MAHIPTLKPFQKGDDPRRNKGGRPVGSTKEMGILKLLAKMLDEDLPSNPDKTYKDALVKRIIEKALRGHFPTMKMIWDRLEGKIPRPGSGFQRSPEYVPEIATRVYANEERTWLEGLIKKYGYVDVVVPPEGTPTLEDIKVKKPAYKTPDGHLYEPPSVS